ncbi:MAG: hypoxanthine phosphoribosyltransferase [Planctomycetota bacterium]
MQRDIEAVLIDAERIRERVGELAAQIARDTPAGPGGVDDGSLVLVPVMTGAMVMTADLVRRMPIKLRLELVAVSSYPGRSMESKGASIAGELPSDIEGKHIVIVDDILDSGHTIAVLRRLFEERRPASVRVCVLLEKQRNDGPAVAEADYVGFTIPDAFVVGYGLDYDGYYRNLPEIVTLKPEAIEA